MLMSAIFVSQVALTCTTSSTDCSHVGYHVHGKRAWGSSRIARVQMGIFQVVHLGLTAEEAYQRVQQLQPFVPFRDASCGPPSFNLSVQHCIMVRL